MISDPNPDRPVIARRAPAKLNLALAVGPPRAEDGYHPICSWMATIDLADELLVTRLEDDRLSRYAILWHDEAPVRSDIDWSITRDLAVRAHLMLEQVMGRSLPVQLKLEKRIPVGGGLGGGSSNAASMLVATRELFGLDLDDEALIQLGHRLGSDVPFFVHAALRDERGEAERGAAVISGLGEAIETSLALRATGVLILPGFGCATGSVYRAFDAEPMATDHDGFHARAERVGSLAAGAAAPGWEEGLFNDLATAAQTVSPALREVLDTAADIAERPAHVTGSGSACFIVLDGVDEPERAALIADLDAELDSCVIVPFRV